MSKDYFPEFDPIAERGVRGTSLLHLKLAAVFPDWSSNRIAKWLGINPRSLQRMLAREPDGSRQAEIPPGLVQRVEAQGQIVQDVGVGPLLDTYIDDMLRNGVDEEVLAAWLASRYRKLMDREID